MKTRIAILILFLIPSIGTYSQTVDMVQEGRKWAVMISATGLEPSLLPKVETKTSILRDDTTVNHLIYKKIYSGFNEDLSDLKLEGCIRQNDGKIFFLPFNSAEEKVYFDFSLEVGDTFLLNDISRSVTSTGNILLNGINCKTLSLKNGNEEDIWVEGIGSLITGIFSDSFVSAGGKYLLLCCHQENTLLYMNEEYNDCFIQENNTDVKEVEQETMMPRVYFTNETLRIKGAKGQVFKFELLDILGKKLLISKDIVSDDEFIDLSYLNITAGTYIYRLFNETCNYTNKLLIER